MSWFDNISNGAGNLVDWFRGSRGGDAAAGGGGGGGAAAPAAAGPDTGWGNGGLAKATGLSPWVKVLGVGQGNSPAADPASGGGKATSNGVEFDSDEASKSFGRSDKGGFNMPQRQNWDISGKSYGNLDSQADADSKGEKVKMGAPGVWQPDLSKIPRTTTGVPGLKDPVTGDINDKASTTAGSF